MQFHDPRAILPEVEATLVPRQDLLDLAGRCCNATESDLGLEGDICHLLGPQLYGVLESLDTALAYLRRVYPTWAFGFQDVEYAGHTGPMAWLNNRQCKKTGFENSVNFNYRYFVRCGKTLEGTFAALICYAEAYRLGTISGVSRSPVAVAVLKTEDALAA